MPSRSERAEALIARVKSEVEQAEKGEDISFTTTRELATAYGHSNDRKISSVLKSLDPSLYYRRKALFKPHRKPFTRPGPSSELAWTIGAISGSGHSNPNDNQATLFTVEEDFAEQMRAVASELFQVNPSVRTDTKDDLKPYHWVVINSSNVTEFLGNLSRSQWPTTVQEQHKWVFSSREYRKWLINGFFDGRGIVSLPTHNRRGGIDISTTYIQVANFLAELLSGLGFDKVTFGHNGSKLRGVRIYGYREVINFASTFSTCIRSKEERLQFYRDYTPSRLGYTPEADGILIQEYARLRELAIQGGSRTLTSNQIAVWYLQGLTKYSHRIYSNHFGEGRFSVAREKLESLLGGK